MCVYLTASSQKQMTAKRISLLSFLSPFKVTALLGNLFFSAVKLNPYDVRDKIIYQKQQDKSYKNRIEFVQCSTESKGITPGWLLTNSHNVQACVWDCFSFRNLGIGIEFSSHGRCIWCPYQQHNLEIQFYNHEKGNWIICWDSS